MAADKSRALFERAQQVIPGGVNSPVRAFRSVGGEPPFIARGAGPLLWDVDGKEYVDHVCSWGPLILGHAHPAVNEALAEAIKDGTSFGACTEREVEFAELLAEVVPSIEKVRLVSSGTEATMSALRLARGFTGRNKIVKVVGGYHGHVDFLLVKAGSGAATLGVPDSAGVPPGTAQDTLLVSYNDLAGLEALLGAHAGEVAAVIIEPVAGNMGVVPPAEGYLQGLRRLTSAAGTLLIFDEVITGFRVALGGAQQLYGVKPDLTCLGKIIGGGLPVGAYGGRAEIMDRIAPDGPIYQAGTLSGNPLAVAAGLTAVQTLKTEDPYPKLEELTRDLTDQLAAAARAAGVASCINRVGSMFTAFFTEGPVTDFDTAATSDTARYGRYHGAMLEAGIYLAPSQYEAAFVSTSHQPDHLERTMVAARKALASL